MRLTTITVLALILCEQIINLLACALGVVMTVKKYMLDRFGPLMTVEDIAQVLGRSAVSVRNSISNNNETSQRLKPTIVRIGRRIRFRTAQVHDVLQLDASEDQL